MYIIKSHDIFPIWWRNIYRSNSNSFCEMKSATKYLQVFSAISKDQRGRGNGLSLVTGLQDCLIASCRPDFTTRLCPPGTAKVQDAFLRCTIARNVTCWFSVCCRSCRLVASQLYPQLLSERVFLHQQRVPHPGSPLLQVWLLSSGEEEHRMCQPLCLAVGLQVYIAVVYSIFH